MKNTIETLVNFLVRMREAHISYKLEHSRDEAVMVVIKVPGQIWEVEFFQDGEVEVEVFKSNGEIGDEKKLDELFRDFSD